MSEGEPTVSNASRWTLRAAVVLSSLLPYVVAFLRTPHGSRFLWIYPPYPEDMLSYLAWTRQAADGHVLLSLKYTTQPHAPFFFNPFFLISGWVGALTHLDLGVVHLVMKSAGVLLFVIVLERYLDSLGLTRLGWFTAAIFVCFASGFGAFLPFIRPADLWIPEINTGWSLLWNPLYPYSLALTLFALHRMHVAVERESMRDACVAGAAAGLLAIVHPYHLPVVIAVVCVDAFLERGFSSLRFLLGFAVVAAPFALYPAWVSATVDVVRQHNTAAAMASPPVWSYALGLGLPLVFAIAAVARGEWRRFRMPVLWAVCAFLAAYAPVWFARKMIFSVHIPVAILGGAACARLLASAGRLAPIAAAAIAALVLATPGRLLIESQREIDRKAFDNPFVISDERYDAMRFLRTTPDQSVVFADLATMRLVPALAGNRVPFGHWAQTVDAQAALDWSNAVFGRSGLGAAERRARFWSAGIDYVLLDGPLLAVARRGRLDWLFAGCAREFENRSAMVLRRPR